MTDTQYKTICGFCPNRYDLSPLVQLLLSSYIGIRATQGEQLPALFQRSANRHLQVKTIHSIQGWFPGNPSLNVLCFDQYVYIVLYIPKMCPSNIITLMNNYCDQQCKKSDISMEWLGIVSYPAANIFEHGNLNESHWHTRKR